MLRPSIVRRIGVSARLRQRALHTLPNDIHRFQEGVPELLTAHGVDVAWTQYQGLMLDRLNKLIADTPMEQKPVKDIAIANSRDQGNAPIFNYASMAHNNHFFFSGLSASETTPPPRLMNEIKASFTSLETLRAEMITTASVMFGPGFVWLVRNGSNKEAPLGLLVTYLAGSPYHGAHYRKQGVDMNNEPGVEGQPSSIAREAMRGSPVNTAGSHGPLSTKQDKRRAPGGVDVNPILCINTWEHAYITDYGVGGKRTFANNWWKRINWQEVEARAFPSSGGYAT